MENPAPDSRRVVVTGMGVVTSIGTNVADFWAGCREAKVGVGPLGGFALHTKCRRHMYKFWTSTDRV